MSLTDDINAFADRILALERENERLNVFVDLITMDIEWWESKEHATERLKQVIAVFREIRPMKGANDDGDLD